MSLVNLRFYKSGKFFWDERANSLEDQVLMPIEDPVEMGHSLAMLVKQLQKDDLPAFREAFGTPEVTEQRLARALAQFIRSMVSVRSIRCGTQCGRFVQTHFPTFRTGKLRQTTVLWTGEMFSAIYLTEVTLDGPVGQSAFFQLQLRWSMESMI